MRNILRIVAASLLFSCTGVERDNCWDSGGKNYMGLGCRSSSVVSCSNVGNYSCDMSGYRTVEINGQVWMAQNLNCDVESSYCYDKKTENCSIYGRLYDWCTAMAVCQNGWHLPSEAEWEELLDFAGGQHYFAGLHLKANSGWDDDEYGKSGNGEDTYKFSALPGGQGYSTDHYGYGIGRVGYWWTATEHSTVYGSYTAISMSLDSAAGISSFKKEYTFSVRCVRD